MDAEGSHSGDGNGCGDGERCRGEGMVVMGSGGGRAERAACRRYAIVVSPTQTAPEVPAVWGCDNSKSSSVS